MGKATIRWFDRNIDEEEQRIYRSESTIDPMDLPAPLTTVAADVEEYVDETVEDDKVYYYRVSSVKGDLEKVSDEITIDTSYNLGPGSDTLVGGGARAGFFGEVPVSEMISGDALAAEIGLTAGTSQHSSDPWLKFVIDGDILYTGKKTFRYGLSWDDIDAVNAVYDDKNAPIVTIDGFQFRVTLLTGAEADPTVDENGIGSEWNRLIYRVHEDVPSDQEGDNWAEYTDAELLVDSSAGDGSYSWCQETRASDDGRRVFRGSSGVSYFSTATSDYSYSRTGWRPALRLLK